MLNEALKKLEKSQKQKRIDFEQKLTDELKEMYRNFKEVNFLTFFLIFRLNFFENYLFFPIFFNRNFTPGTGQNLTCSGGVGDAVAARVSLYEYFR